MGAHDCFQLIGDFCTYFDGEATAVVCAEIEKHLTDCENCRVVFDTLEKTIALVHQLPQPGMPDHLRERLYNQVAIGKIINE